jgi:hypothetical protein
MRIIAMREEIYKFQQKAQSRELIRFELCGTTFPDKSYEINRKNSTVNCIEYVESGSGTVHLDATTFHPEGGDAYFLQSRKNQHYYADASAPWKKHFINFSGPLAESLTEGYGLSHQSHFVDLDIRDELYRIIEIGKQNGGDATCELIGILNEIFFKMRAHQKKASERIGIEYEMKDFLNTQITSKFKMELLSGIELNILGISRKVKLRIGHRVFVGSIVTHTQSTAHINVRKNKTASVV